MQVLNFPVYHFQLTEGSGKTFIFDPVRKKNVALTPEEWVRQHVISYFIQTLNFPQSLIAVERALTFNKRRKRFDLLVYNKTGKPEILVECKSSGVTLSKETLFQIATYNMVFEVPYLFVSNGMQHLLFMLNKEGKYESTDVFPVI